MPAVDLAHCDLAGGEQRPQEHGHGFGAGQHGLGLDPTAKLLVQTLDGIGGPGGFPLRGIEAGKGKEPISGLLQAIGHRLAFQAPLAKEGLAAFVDFGRGIGVDHVAIILGEFVMHMLGGVGQQVAMLVNGAALDGQVVAPERHQRGLQTWSTVDDHEFGTLQATAVEILEELTPRRCALTAHVSDR